ncbi:MAG: glutamate synthase-related protein [Methanothrix sp.]|jgi:glutamate synthase domain-containing protein 2|uniref:Archaeal glutamate synthase [NADPH] n=1 Tax=Methanothrix harundinacea TaxID=301375 RepID=A0A101FTH9_9EURY|nr:MAG: Archaeal glutamate synthase [Methanothrix harundinacea]MDD2637640.1 glutamate synthase-related protein [Methanothrix sp.]MDI9398436.1 glutamate synthase-related protein [Euryarchaeota archaeon]KUK96044.1 MAG: Archaeal glutamate synthase [Methanothrix harundinacea]MCP1391896.1 IMP dehydrogenase [Methanothrix harundinacea]
MRSFVFPEFQIIRDEEKCGQCRACERHCSFGVHTYDPVADRLVSDERKCAGCQRCAVFCPKGAIIVRPSPSYYRPNASWSREKIEDLKRQAETGGVLLTGCGSDKPFRIYWDHIVLNASQVTNPSIDPLREPMELRTFLGRKPDLMEIAAEDGDIEIKTELSPNLVVETPILFSAMSYGAISYNAFRSLATAACRSKTYFNTGEGGLPREMRDEFGRCAIVQVASGRFGIDAEYLNCAQAVEIKVGQGAKPGIGGHLPGEKVSASVAETRMIPPGTDAISPAPHHDIYSIEDLAMLISALKEATNYEKPISVKIAAVHNFAAIATGIVHAGADIIAIDGLRGGTGAAPKAIRDNVGIPTELAISSLDRRLRDEGIRNRCSIITAGGIRCSADVVKAIALGADAVYIGSAALIAMGCTLCQKCYTGKCNWGICTQDPRLSGRLNVDIASARLTNLISAWSHEIREMLGGMGINALESLRGNRDHLRGIGLYEWELDVLGIKGAGE